MMNWRNIFSSAGWGIGGFALSQNENIQFSVSSTVLLGTVALICVTVIVLVYRLTNKADAVALVKAWRSGNSNQNTNSKKPNTSTPEEENKNNSPSPPP